MSQKGNFYRSIKPRRNNEVFPAECTLTRGCVHARIVSEDFHFICDEERSRRDLHLLLVFGESVLHGHEGGVSQR